jgi:hypothetical protein
MVAVQSHNKKSNVPFEILEEFEKSFDGSKILPNSITSEKIGTLSLDRSGKWKN